MIIWDITKGYIKDTIVSRNNIRYKAIKDVPEESNINITDTEYWERLTSGASVIGRVVPIPQGDWNSTKSYTKLDIVYNNGVSYIAKKNIPAGTPIPPLLEEDNKPPKPTSNEYWQVLAEGTSGEKGEQGIPGERGPRGKVYFPIFDVDFTNGSLYVTYYDDNEPEDEQEAGDTPNFYIVDKQHETDEEKEGDLIVELYPQFGGN